MAVVIVVTAAHYHSTGSSSKLCAVLLIPVSTFQSRMPNMVVWISRDMDGIDISIKMKYWYRYWYELNSNNMQPYGP